MLSNMDKAVHPINNEVFLSLVNWRTYFRSPMLANLIFPVWQILIWILFITNHPLLATSTTRPEMCLVIVITLPLFILSILTGFGCYFLVRFKVDNSYIPTAADSHPSLPRPPHFSASVQNHWYTCVRSLFFVLIWNFVPCRDYREGWLNMNSLCGFCLWCVLFPHFFFSIGLWQLKLYSIEFIKSSISRTLKFSHHSYARW